MQEDKTIEDIVDLPYADDPELAQIKMQPHSLEAEQAVLGGLLIAPEHWDSLTDIVLAEDFYRPEHATILQNMSQLAEAGQPIDPVTVAAALDNSGRLESVGGLAYLTALAKDTPSTSNIRAYATVVRERAALRHLIRAAQDIADSGYNPEGRRADELIDAAERTILQVAEQGPKRGGPVVVDELVKPAIERIQHIYQTGGGVTGVATGYTKLDEMTSGLQPSDLIIVAGRPGMGKTSFAMNVVEHAVLKQDQPVLVFSMEMPAQQLIVRLLSSIGHVDQSRIRNGKLHRDDWDKLGKAAAKIEKAPLYIDDTPGLTPTVIRSRARRLAREKGDLAMIVVDYLQLMQVAGFKEGRTAEITEISRHLKAIARELECPLMALSQLNRSVEGRVNRRPVNSDLRESGAIEQDADLIMFIYRDEVYNEDSPDQGVGEIIIGKQRNGPTGTCKLAFINHYTRFENLAYEDDGRGQGQHIET